MFTFLSQQDPAVICLQESHLTCDTTHLLPMSKYPIQYHSVHTRYPRGVSTLFSKTTAFTKRDAYVYSEGRFVFLMDLWESHACVIANIYVPPPFTLTVLQCLSRILAKHPQLPVYVLGDFNRALDTSLDVHKKYCSQSPRLSTALAKFITELGLVDLWRCNSPPPGPVLLPFIDQYYTIAYRLCTRK